MERGTRIALYEKRSPTRWNGYMITWPVASSTEPTVLPVVFVTRSVVYSACSDAHPVKTKNIPAINRSGRIRFFLGIVNSPIDELTFVTGESSKRRAGQGRRGTGTCFAFAKLSVVPPP